jgi:hypothetical protein
MTVILVALLTLFGQQALGAECSIDLSSCFSASIPDLEAGDIRLQPYETEVKSFLKSLKPTQVGKALPGHAFKNKSEFLRGWTLLKRARKSNKYAYQLKGPAGESVVFTWSDGTSFPANLSQVCQDQEPREFLTGEVYTSAQVGSSIVVVGECGADRVFSSIR